MLAVLVSSPFSFTLSLCCELSAITCVTECVLVVCNRVRVIELFVYLKPWCKDLAHVAACPFLCLNYGVMPAPEVAGMLMTKQPLPGDVFNTSPWERTSQSNCR